MRHDIPKIAPNAVWLYHSNNGMKKIRALRTLEVPAFLAIFLFTGGPIFHMVMAGFAYHFILKSSYWLNAYRLAVRLDYLPNVDMVSVTKVGPFGVYYNNLWKPSDFEQVNLLALIPQGRLTRVPPLVR